MTLRFEDIIDDVEVAPVERAEFDNKDRGQSIDDLNPIPTDEVDDDYVEPSELEDTEEVEETEEEGDEVEEDDGEEVDYENYDIELPSGETTTLAELVNGYRDSQALEAARAELEQAREDFLEQSGKTSEYLTASKMEADEIIDEYKNFNWSKVKAEDPEDYIAHKDFYDKAVERKAYVLEKLETLKQDEAEKAQRQRIVDARNANAILARDIPGWNGKMFEEIYNYAIENGVSQEAMDNCTDPDQIKMLNKAMQFDRGQKVAKAKVKKIGSPTKVVKSEGSNKPEPVNTAKIFNKVRSGQASKQEKAMAYANIKD